MLREEFAKDFNATVDLLEPDFHVYEVINGGEDMQCNVDERRDFLSVRILCLKITAE